MHDAQNVLANIMASVLTQLIDQGMSPPIYCVTVGSNGAIAGFHYVDDGGPGLSCHPVTEYFPNGEMRAPIHVFLTDGNQAGKVVIERPDQNVVQ
jgi:hypothetical protein